MEPQPFPMLAASWSGPLHLTWRPAKATGYAYPCSEVTLWKNRQSSQNHGKDTANFPDTFVNYRSNTAELLQLTIAADKLGYYSIAIAHDEGCFLDKQKYNTVFIRGEGSLRLLSLFLFLFTFTLPNKLSTLNKAWVSPHKEHHTMIALWQHNCVNWSNVKTWSVSILHRLIIKHAFQ
jgi:hypothetical protein